MTAFNPRTVMLRDVFPLRKLLSKREGDPDHLKGLARLANSQQLLSSRQASVPEKIEFPEALPISAHLDKVSQYLKNGQVVIVAGETGSGKTTQLPKMCLNAGFGLRGKIAHTQPRRIAARAVSQRIAEELNDPSGNLVGYSVRFSDTSSPENLVKVLTDGLLLAEIRSDRYLNQYEVIIVDEAHERSLNIDFLLGYLKELLPKRPDLKLIVTSATIDVKAFSSYFDDAPIVSVSGRGFPVEEVYSDNNSDLDLGEQIFQCLMEINQSAVSKAQDVLVFLTGEREIFEVAQSLRENFRNAGNHFRQYSVLPLYARLSASEQHKVFNPSGNKRVILATNVAETSITVPNIGFVIDPGQVRMSRYNHKTKLQRLPVEAVSQASANQRKGRCGRIAPGVCYRLYSKSDFENRPEFTDPEILRTSLASVVLQMRAFRLGNEQSFPFLNMPQQSAINDAVTALVELGAFKNNKLTQLGRLMARLPVDPRLAKILVSANANGSLKEALVIVSALALQDPRERPLAKQQAADQAHSIFKDEKSDFLVYLNIWEWSELQREELSRKAYSRKLQKQFISVPRMREWRELHRQLLIVCRANKMQISRSGAVAATYESIHQALLPGFLGHLGLKDEKGVYLGARQLKFSIFPGSVLFKPQPKWVMCAEIAETGKVYARCVAQVDVKWVERCAKHLLKSSYSEPHWSVKREEVQAYQRITLYGLPLVERRLVRFSASLQVAGQADLSREIASCREIFLSSGLVRGGASTRNRNFLSHNLALVRQVLAKEDTYRRRDLLLHDDHLIAFYEQRIPVDIVDMQALDKWRKSAEQQKADVLFMGMGDVLSSASLPSAEMFPPELLIQGNTYPLKYKFAPGEVDDGVSIQLAAGQLETISRERLEWLVPGLLMSKCEQMVRNLPKNLRRKIVPIPQVIEELEEVLLRESDFGVGSLPNRLGELLQGFRSVKIDNKIWNNNELSDNNKINIQIRGPGNKLVEQGRDIDKLLLKITHVVKSGSSEKPAVQVLQGEFPVKGVKTAAIVSGSSGHLLGYPALEDQQQNVALVLVESRKIQMQKNRQGYARLALLIEHKAASFLRRNISSSSQMALHFAALGESDTLKDQILITSAWYCFFEGKVLPESKQVFDDCIESFRGDFGKTVEHVVVQVRQILKKRFELIALLSKANSPAFQPAVLDIRFQIDNLVNKGFLLRTPSRYLNEISRYLDAAVYRLQHLQGRVDKDTKAMNTLSALEHRMYKLVELLPVSEELEALRYLLEELRVMLFAQSLKVRVKVSAVRIEQKLLQLEASIPP
ncbi:MAG: ATP-dependent RNA helicase HrpA [Pseudomonadales bacterium]|nr:ATP-dependent RNA helicase HrpA [Pseudomonadales bacterium]